MFSILFYLHTPDRVQGPLYVRVHPGNLRRSTKIILKPGQWNHKAQRIIKHDYANELNALVKDIEGKVFRAAMAAKMAGEVFDSKSLALVLDPEAKEKPKKAAETPSEVYERWKVEYLREANEGNDSGVVKGANYARRPNQVIERLAKFRPDLKLQDITPEVVKAYRSWLLNETKVQDNTINQHYKIIRMLLKYAGLPFEFVKTAKEKHVTRYDLQWSEVQQLRAHRYSSPELEQAAHAFVMNCQICLRADDMAKVTPDHFLEVESKRHGKVKVINLNQGKTGDPVFIPVPPGLTPLFERYGWQYPLPVDGTRVYRLELYNKRLKLAAAEAGLTRKIRTTKSRGGHVTEAFKPLSSAISSHDSRHTGKSRVLEITKNKDLADMLLGHANNDTYTHIDPISIVDDLLDAWAQYE